LGYNAKLITDDGTKISLEIQESDKGFCMIEVTNIEKGKIEISYTGTNLMKLSYILTALGGVAICIFGKNLKKLT